MQPSRQKLGARLLLGLGVTLGLVWLARLDYARKISTDLLDLIPVDERSPELALVRTLSGERQARVALFALKVPAMSTESPEEFAERRTQAGAAFIAELGKSPAFAEVMLMGDTAARDALGRYVFQHRFDLLLPGWLAVRAREYRAAGESTPWCQWLAERTAADLEKSLARPEALALQSIFPADPLLLVPEVVEKMQGFVDPGRSPDSDGGAVVIWARTTAAPLREEGQEPVFAAVAGAWAAARSAAPGAELRWTAISRFAAESRRRIEHEMSVLNVISLLGVLAVAAVSVRRVFKALHLVPVMLCALLGAWVATTMVFERVHVLVFVVGSLLGGVAVDYGFYLYLQPPRRPGEPYREKVGRLLKPLLASALTTVIGFSLLLFSELPLIRQLGVFVSAGLLCALAAALLWFAQVDEPFLETRAFIRFRGVDSASGRGRRWRWLIVAGVLVALVGPWRLHWHDDIRELEIPAPTLHIEDAEVRAFVGENPSQTIYLTRGETAAAARTALERFLAWQGGAFPDSMVASVGTVLPTVEEWTMLPERVEALADFEPQLQAALTRHGFTPEEFAPFFTAWRDWRQRPGRPGFEDLATGLTRELRGALGLLMSAEPGAYWFATIANHPPGATPPAETATVEAAQLQTLNNLFGRYRVSALRLSAFGLGLVGLSVFVLYRPRRGLRIFALPSGSCLFAFGVFGLAGQTMNLFHLLGAFLGVCLSHNYAIFSAENAARGETPPPSIRLSALTTAVSFGVLALSHIPVVAALGSMVALIVLTALVVVELEPFAPAVPGSSPAAPADRLSDAESSGLP
jgi:predicted exporter